MPDHFPDDPVSFFVATAYEQITTGKTIRRRWIPWATMLLRVFAVDVLACPTIRQDWRIGRNRGAISTLSPAQDAGAIHPCHQNGAFKNPIH